MQWRRIIGRLTQFGILVFVPLSEVHIEELHTMELSCMLRKFFTSIATRKYTFTYLEVFKAKAPNIERVIMELTKPIMGEAMERQYT